jgi:hypothetical protein
MFVLASSSLLRKGKCLLVKEAGQVQVGSRVVPAIYNVCTNGQSVWQRDKWTLFEVCSLLRARHRSLTLVKWWDLCLA